MGFWTGFFVGIVLGQAAVAIGLALAKRANKATFNHNHWD
jgi:hypothetical protein